MTLRDLKKEILIALYSRYKEKISGTVSFNGICEYYNIKYDSQQQVFNAIKSLRDAGYVKAVFFSDNKGIITEITPKGIEYIENDDSDDYIGLDADGGYIDRRFVTKSQIYHNANVDNPAVNSPQITRKNTYYAHEQYQTIKDKNIEPCFGVEQLSECFVQQMDKIADSQQENICMLGIFAPWGRGKSYFFNKIKERLIARSHINFWEKIIRIFNNDNNFIDYKIVEFNVWKYQDAPALWAYLYETIYKNSLNTCMRIKWFIKNIKWKDLLLFFIIVAALYGIYQILLLFVNDPHKQFIKEIIETWRIPVIWLTLSSSVIYAIINNPAGTFSFIRRHFRRPSYKYQLGIQNELEEMLEELLCTIIRKNKEKLLLYVDDIDRCSTEKMLSVIDSLRTILENERIRDRLIIICSVDADKLKQGYINHYRSAYSDIEQCKWYAREQIDKVFISSIGLSTLDLSQKISFIDKLIDVTGSTSDIEQYLNTPFNTRRDRHSSIPMKRPELKNISAKEIALIIKKFLLKEENSNATITPRKLRIMYYQLWMANNILSKHSNTLFPEELAMNILGMSLNYDKNNIYLDDAMSDIIEMVVPY